MANFSRKRLPGGSGRLFVGLFVVLFVACRSLSVVRNGSLMKYQLYGIPRQ
ncbi:MAG TPA: hypothetical protein VHW43_11095 [Puia sp.]|nr:hypothetical protein [Puia sp.]